MRRRAIFHSGEIKLSRSTAGNYDVAVRLTRSRTARVSRFFSTFVSATPTAQDVPMCPIFNRAAEKPSRVKTFLLCSLTSVCLPVHFENAVGRNFFQQKVEPKISSYVRAQFYCEQSKFILDLCILPKVFTYSRRVKFSEKEKEKELICV